MRRQLCLWLIGAFLLLGMRPLAAQTDDRGQQLLNRVAASFRAMGRYEVHFTIRAGEDSAEGEYAVSGETYYLKMGMAEVFCDGKQRYEADHRRREVVINKMNPQSHNILENPAHAFDYWQEQYLSKVEWERDDQASIALTPRNAVDAETERVTILVDLKQNRPLEMVYNYDSERIVISLKNISLLGGAVPHFEKKEFADYEMIDFR